MLFSLLVIGKRRVSDVLSVLRRKESYGAMFRALTVLESPLSLIWREVLSRSSGNLDVRVRTPIGKTRIHLNGSADLSTVFGVFCRNDYRADLQLNVAVDLGANIGVATLYFLTRNERAFVYAYEPVPRNVETFRINAAPFAGRYELAEDAVGAESGTVSFGIEPTGKFGGIKTAYSNRITVKCLAINDVLENVLSKHSVIDCLKVDVEGTEAEIIAAIAPEHWQRIGRIYAENCDSTAVMPKNFRRTFRYNVECLQRAE